VADDDLLDTNTDPDAAAPEGAVEPTAATAEATAPSIRDTLKAAFKDDVGKDAAPGDRPRNPDGTFAPTKAEAAPKPAAAQPAPVSPDLTGAKPAPVAPSNAPAGPPTSWSPEAKAAYTQLPPAVQQAVSRREEEVSRGFAQYQGLKQRADEFERVIAPNRHIYASEGVSDAQAVANIWQWFHAIRNEPSKAFPALAEMVGYDLSTVGFDAADDPSQASQPDPRIAAELNALRGKVGQFETWQQQQEQARMAERLTSWSNGKEHYEAVRVDMGKLMLSGIVPMGDLDAAYERAMKLHGLSPTPAPPPAPVVDPAIRTRNARHAAVSPKPTAPNGAMPGGKPRSTGSVRDSLRESISQLQS